MTFLRYKYLKDNLSLKSILSRNHFVAFFLLNSTLSSDVDFVKRTFLLCKCKFFFCKNSILALSMPKAFMQKTFIKGRLFLVYSNSINFLNILHKNVTTNVFFKKVVSLLFSFYFQKRLMFYTNNVIGLLNSPSLFCLLIQLFFNLCFCLTYSYNYFKFFLFYAKQVQV